MRDSYIYQNSLLFLLLATILLFCCGCGAPSENREAPQMSVTAGDSKITAQRSTFSWFWENGGVEADGMHPLDLADDLPSVKVPADRTVRFQFGTIPDTITISAWKGSGSRQTDKPDLTLSASQDGTVMLPDDDSYIYEVHAIWDEKKGTGGDAFYGFISVP